MSIILSVALLGGMRAPFGALFLAKDKEAKGFDEEIPEEKVEPPVPEPVEPVKEEKPGPGKVERPVPRAPDRRLRLALEAGGFLPLKGRGTEYGPTFTIGATASQGGGSRAGVVVSFDYAGPASRRGTDQFFLVQAGMRLSLSDESVSTCPLYAGFAAGLAVEDPTDDYGGDFLGNLGPSVSVGLGVRLGGSFDLGVEYVLFPGSENSPGAGILSAGYSF